MQTAIIGMICAAIGSVIAWFFARRKKVTKVKTEVVAPVDTEETDKIRAELDDRIEEAAEGKEPEAVVDPGLAFFDEVRRSDD